MTTQALTSLTLYIRQVFDYRHFWVHLALSDLRSRFRRSYLGILWIIIQPMLLTVIMATVFKFVFKQAFADYAVYVFSGMIAWEFITGSINLGAVSFVSAEGYVRQVRLPMIIYPLKTILYCCIVFVLAFAGFCVFTLAIKPEVFSWTWVFLPLSLLMLALFATPLAIISAIINIKFRDYQQFIVLILQVLWYLSPIMMPPQVFDHPGLREWTAINPIAAIMDTLRLPLVNHEIPSLHSYAMVVVYAALLWALAIRMLARDERKIVFFF